MIIHDLKQQIKDLYDKIEEIQQQCSHPQACLEVKHDSDTGNYDPTQDCSWTTYHCTLCDKKWTEEDK